MKEPSLIGTFENAGAALVRARKRSLFVKSLLISSLENVIKYDADPDLLAAAERRLAALMETTGGSNDNS